MIDHRARAEEYLGHSNLTAQALVHALLHLADVLTDAQTTRTVDLTPPEPAREDHLR